MQKRVIATCGPKGGIWKSTATQCISTSEIFAPYECAILEADSQKTLLDWQSERPSNLGKLPIKIIPHNQDRPLKEEIREYREQFDYLFIDLPGESEALDLTRSALGYADLCLFPLRTHHKDITAFDKHFRPVIKEIIEYRDRSHYRILCTFAHINIKTQNYLKRFENIKIIDKLEHIHRDRPVYTYFSIGGLTLREYAESCTDDKGEWKKAQGAVEDIELIAQEVLDIVK